MTRHISKGKYFMAAFVTTVIFLLGLSVGLVIEGKRVQYVGDLLDSQKVEFSSSQLQYNYVEGLNTIDSCPAIYRTYYTNLKNLDRARIRLENYARDNKINEESFDLLKRQYSIEQIRYWLLSQKAEDLCGSNHARMLYFYGTDKDCPDCEEQAFVLNYLKSIFQENLLIFALDSNFEDEPMIGILLTRYGVSEYPTMILDDEVLPGYQGKDALLAKICERVDSEKCP